MAISIARDEENRIIENIGRILEEAKASNATHIRKLKDLSSIKSSSPLNFFSAFSKTLTPLFNYQRRVASAERIVRFVSAFATAPDCDEFLQDFLRFLIVATAAANKTARFRACQIISEVYIYFFFTFFLLIVLYWLVQLNSPCLILISLLWVNKVIYACESVFVLQLMYWKQWLYGRWLICLKLISYYANSYF